MNAATYYVSPSGSNTSSGSLSAPFQTVSRAVSAVSPGDTIILQDGTYGSEGSTGYPVNLQKAGSSTAWFTIQAQNKGKAILDCQNTGGTSQTTQNGCTGYIYANSAAKYWKLSGLVFTRAWMVGINIWGSTNIVIQDCEFANLAQNSSSAAVGYEGIYIDSGDSITVDSSYFHDIGRTGRSGDHGIYTHGTNSRITNSIFQRPIPGYEIQAASGFSGTIEENTFAFTSGTGDYGEIVLWNAMGAVSIRNNIFYKPIAVAVHEDTASFSGGCIIDHNIIYGVSSVQDAGSCNATNNTFADPKFVNATTAPYDFHLQAGSPAIDTAASTLALTRDYDGNPRPLGSGYDIGAYEYKGTGSSLISTSTSLQSSVNPATYGQAISLSATVTSSSGSPTGSVTFSDGGTTLGTAALSGNTAALSVSNLQAATHSITAAYSGDSTHSSSASAPLSQVVGPAGGSTAVASSANPSTASQSVTFTASITTSAGNPTGTVSFYDGSTVLNSALVSSGKASVSTASLASGTHSIKAVYSGDANHAGSTSSVISQTVNTSTAPPPTQTATAISLASSANPVSHRKYVTFTATVRPATSTTSVPTGTVTFYNGSSSIGTVTLSGGVAKVSVRLARGIRSMTAAYSGDTTFAVSKSPVLSEQVY